MASGSNVIVLSTCTSGKAVNMQRIRASRCPFAFPASCWLCPLTNLLVSPALYYIGMKLLKSERLVLQCMTCTILWCNNVPLVSPGSMWIKEAVMLFQRKVLCLCLNPGYDSTSILGMIVLLKYWKYLPKSSGKFPFMGLGPVFLWDLGQFSDYGTWARFLWDLGMQPTKTRLVASLWKNHTVHFYPFLQVCGLLKTHPRNNWDHNN